MDPLRVMPILLSTFLILLLPELSSHAGELSLSGDDPRTSNAQLASNDLVRMTPAQLVGRQVLTRSQAEVGTVQKVMLSRRGHRPFAVTKANNNGQLALPFNLLQSRNDGNLMFIPAPGPSTTDLDTRYRYVAGDFYAIPEHQVIAQAMKEPVIEGRELASFNELDNNQDGVISPAEAKGNPLISYNWKSIDRNHDGVVDRAEFDAFEKALQNEKVSPAIDAEKPAR